MNRKTIRILMLLLVAMGLGIGEAKSQAVQQKVKYMGWDDAQKKLVEMTTPEGVNVTVLEGSTSTEVVELGGWYVVNGTVNYNGHFWLNSETHLILSDGAQLTCPMIGGSSCSLFVYGQGGHAEGSTNVAEGILNVTTRGIQEDNITINGGQVNTNATEPPTPISSSYNGIFAYYNLTINGGKVTATSEYNDCIFANIDVTINGGQVAATAGVKGGSGIYASGKVTINDGQVTATASNTTGSFWYYGIWSNVIINGGQVTASGPHGGINGGDITLDGGDITLGWTKSTDFIKCSSYSVGSSGTLKTATGKRFDAYTYDGSGKETFSTTIEGGTTIDASGLTTTILRPANYKYGVKYLKPNASGSALVEDQTSEGVKVWELIGDETELGTDGEETWYVTTSETATFTNTITLNGDVHIILANGTTMNVEPSTGNGIFTDTYNLYIHGQQNRSGKLNVVASGNGIYSKDMNIYGAEVMAKSTNQDAIHANNEMNIFDSKVTATGGNFGIYAETYMNITGGQVKTEGGSTSDGMIYGINCPINLTWKKSSDYLQSKGYGDDLTIAKGQYFYMTEVDTYGKQNPISGTISESSINEDIPIGAKLVPALPVQGGSPYVGFFMTSGGWSLPGDVKAFTPQGYNLAAGTASLAEISGVPDSRTVILGSATDGGNLPSTFYLIGTTVENAANYMNSYQANPFQSNFKTSETGLTLGEMIGDTDENIALILSDGSFKSFNYPSSLSQRPDPQHVFLIVSKWDMLTKGSSSGGGSGARSIGIDTGATTGIKLTPVLSEGDGVWYSLDGRKLSVKPAAKGVYINKGKKYVVR